MVLELILGLSLFHHKHKPPTSAFVDKRMDTAMDTMELNSRTLKIIEAGKQARLEGEEIQKAEDAAVVCFTEKDKEKFYVDVDIFDKVVDELLVVDEFNKALGII